MKHLDVMACGTSPVSIRLGKGLAERAGPGVADNNGNS
jgi:hypothetical protein